MPSIRLISAGALTIVLLLGTGAAFLPFWLSTKQMKDFCNALPLGLTAAAVRDQAAAQGYDVSYEEVFTGPRRHDDGGVDGGDDDGGLIDAGAPDAGDVDAGDVDAGPKVVVGKASIDDPRSYWPRCRLQFDDAGVLTARRYTDD